MWVAEPVASGSRAWWPQAGAGRVQAVIDLAEPTSLGLAVVAAVTTAVEAGLRTAQEQLQLPMAVVAAVQVQ